MTELSIEQALQWGIDAHKAGQVQEADRLYTAILKARPKHPNANHNMGVLAVGVGKVQESLPFLKTALEADPSIAQFWLSYIDALIKLEQLVNAKAVFDQAKNIGAKGDGFDRLEQRLKEASKIDANAPLPQPHILDSLKLDQAIKLAKKKAKDGAPEEANRIYQDILVKFPKNNRAKNGLKVLSGNYTGKISKPQDPRPDIIEALLDLHSRGQLQRALTQIETLVLKFPKSPILFNIRGAVLLGLGQLDQSIKAYNKALAIKPDYAEAYNNMGLTLKRQGKLEKAIEAYNKTLAIKPNYAEAYNNMGHTLQEQNKVAEAMAAYKNALAINPAYAGAHINMGNIFTEQGKLEEAIEAYKKALVISPENTELHRFLSRAVKYKSNDPQINKVEELMKRPNLKDADRCNLYYTFGKMNEDLGHLKTAYENYVKGGALRRKLLAYDPAHDQQLFAKIKKTAPNLKNFALDVSNKTTTHTPIFILGMLRSGTTLVEQIISNHTKVLGAGELPFLTHFGTPITTGFKAATTSSLSNFREAYLNELAKISDGKKFITDKMPSNFQCIGLILKAIPEAKIIHVRRDSAAICWSNFKNYFSGEGQGYSYNLNDTVSYFKLYRDLMSFWDQLYGDQIYHLDYDKLTVEQELETRKLIEHLKLDWEDGCLSPQKNNRSVRTASQQQIRKKVYTGSSQVWRKFEPYLNGAFDELNISSEAPPK